MIVEGTIHDLNTVTREVLVLVNGEILDVDVPVACPVYVNEERVKLRLLQALDRVLVEFKREGDRAIAESIEVRRRAQRRRGEEMVGRNRAETSGNR
jgi:hypothetical protein